MIAPGGVIGARFLPEQELCRRVALERPSDN